MNVCTDDPTSAGPRDAAMIGLTYSGGPRRAEVVGLNVADYDAKTWTVAIRSGKERKDRLTYIEAGAADVLTDWLDARGREPGPLFCPVLQAKKNYTAFDEIDTICYNTHQFLSLKNRVFGASTVALYVQLTIKDQRLSNFPNP